MIVGRPENARKASAGRYGSIGRHKHWPLTGHPTRHETSLVPAHPWVLLPRAAVTTTCAAAPVVLVPRHAVVDTTTAVHVEVKIADLHELGELPAD